ncbi:MAG: glycosyltransferase [Candidatus Accumulibacter sp.]|jgi:phosphatidylinositol alpha-1,6-mannosyltransferase|nr:glycosyltransferase [Accumulibacter sp.]
MENFDSHIIRGFLSVLSTTWKRGHLTNLLFHKVPPCKDPLVHEELCLDEFSCILDFLQEHTKLLQLSEAIDILARGGKLPNRAVCLTFDDGYVEWSDYLAPLLRARNVPATFFITTEPLGGVPLWHERIVAGVRALPDHGVRLPYGLNGYDDITSPDLRLELICKLQALMKYATLSERRSIIDLIESQAADRIIHSRTIGASTVRELHSHGFEIGSHTIHHPILNKCSDKEALAEIAGSREELSEMVRGEISLFAYPNGIPGKDFCSRHVQMVRSSGYKAAVVSTGGVVSMTSDMFQLPRTTLWGKNQRRMAYHLARNFFTRETKLSIQAAKDSIPMDNVRCLLVASTFPPIHGGSAVVYENLCAHMPPGTIRVLTAKNNYLTHSQVPGWKEHDEAVGFPVDRLPYLRPLMLPPPANILVSMYRFIFQDMFLYLRILISAASIVRLHKINIVCIGELVAGSWLGLALRKLLKCKFVIYVHGEEVTTAASGRLYGNCRRYYLHSADKVIAVSSFTCNALVQEMGLPRESIALVPNGVDTERFLLGMPNDEFLIRHELSGKRIILTIGRLVPRKGMDMAIRAMPKIIRKIPDVHYVIVGDGGYRSQLEQIIHEQELWKYVTLVGKVTDKDLVCFLQACDLFIMPNRTMPDGDTEGFGLVFREANACGKPVVGGRAGGAVEAVIDGETGLLVDGYSPDEIADAVVHLLENKELMQQMGENGLRIAHENNTRSVAERFYKICEMLLI